MIGHCPLSPSKSVQHSVNLCNTIEEDIIREKGKRGGRKGGEKNRSR